MTSGTCKIKRNSIKKLGLYEGCNNPVNAMNTGAQNSKSVQTTNLRHSSFFFVDDILILMCRYAAKIYDASLVQMIYFK